LGAWELGSVGVCQINMKSNKVVTILFVY